MFWKSSHHYFRLENSQINQICSSLWDENSLDLTIYCHNQEGLEKVCCNSMLFAAVSDLFCDLMKSLSLPRIGEWVERTPINVILPDVCGEDVINITEFLKSGEKTFESEVEIESFRCLLRFLGVRDDEMCCSNLNQDVKLEDIKEIILQESQEGSSRKEHPQSLNSSFLETRRKVGMNSTPCVGESNVNPSYTSSECNFLPISSNYFNTSTNQNTNSDPLDHVKLPSISDIIADNFHLSNTISDLLDVPLSSFEDFDEDSHNNINKTVEASPESSVHYLPQKMECDSSNAQDEDPPSTSNSNILNSLAVVTYNETGKRKSIFDQFFDLLGEKRWKFAPTRCRICAQSDIESIVTISERSRHMRRCHLPDEKCPKCGEMVRPINTKEHESVCGLGKQSRIKCEKCKKLVTVKSYYRHSITCGKEVDMDGKIKCEVCLKKITIGNMKRHKLDCNVRKLT